MNENLFPAKHPIGVEFFSKKSTKTFQLINNTDSNKQLDAKKQWYSFDFAQPVYIFEVITRHHRKTRFLVHSLV